MTIDEFERIVAYITAACSHALKAESMVAYFDLLGDLEFQVLLTAAKRVMLEHRWSTFPSIAELREAAAETMRGEVKDLSPAEAWGLAWAAVARIDPEAEGSFERGIKGLPPIVVESIRSFGVQALCYGKEPVGVVRGQFIKIFEQIAAREKRTALMPAAVKTAIEDIGRPTLKLPAKVARAIEGVGRTA